MKRGRNRLLEGRERRVCYFYYETDMSVSAIARRFNVSPGPVERILKEHGAAYRQSLKGIRK